MSTCAMCRVLRKGTENKCRPRARPDIHRRACVCMCIYRYKCSRRQCVGIFFTHNFIRVKVKKEYKLQIVYIYKYKLYIYKDQPQ